MDTAVDLRLVERFRADLERVWPECNDANAPRLGIAVSGGPDSVALLLLAHAALPGRVVAATIDHQLRPESGDEAAMVGGLCERLGILHDTVEVVLEPGNLQDRARKARYEALCRCFGDQGADTFATAHHADDQAETLLMRLNRGSGLAGLAGIRERTVLFPRESSGEFLVVRPLLSWRRGELAQIVADAQITPAHDPSNRDEKYDRVQVRNVLTNLPWIDPVAMAHSARHLQEAERAVQDMVQLVWQKYVVEEAGRTWFHFGHGRAVEIEIVRRILKGFGATVRRSSIATMVDRLRQYQPASLGGIIGRREFYLRTPTDQIDSWLFEQEPPRRTR